MKNLQRQNNQNIWIVNHHAITPEMTGSTRHYDMAIELIKRGGPAITIFSSSFRHQGQRKESKLKKNEKWKFENIDGINFIWIRTTPYQKNNWRRVVNMICFMYRAYWLGRKIIKINKNIRKPDIIIGSSPHLLAPLAAYWLSKYYKAKFVMEIRDLWPQTIIDAGKFKESHSIASALLFLEKFLYKKAQKIITLLPFAKNYIVPLGINKNKIIWISNGTDLTKFKKNEKEKFDKHFNVIYTGALGKGNAVSVILDAAKIVKNKKYKDIKFILVGGGPEKENLIKQKIRLKLDNTKLYSAVAKEKIPDILKQADILISRCRTLGIHKYGSSSNKIFDYMAVGKPIISAGNLTNNLIDKVGCGISFLSKDSNALANAIIRLYKIPAKEREEMGQKGHEYVKKYHSIPVLVNKLEKLLNELTN